MIVAWGSLLHLGVHLHQIILFIVIITSHLLYSLAAELAVGQWCTQRNIAGYKFFSHRHIPFTIKFKIQICSRYRGVIDLHFTLFTSNVHIFILKEHICDELKWLIYFFRHVMPMLQICGSNDQLISLFPQRGAVIYKRDLMGLLFKEKICIFCIILGFIKYRHYNNSF